MVARGRLTDLAYQQVREGILRGELSIGSVLDESDLARTLGTSRTPVRHALGRLLQEGLIEIGSRRQAVVRGFSAEHRAEILLLREALETLAVKRACGLMGSDQIDRLRLLLIQQQRSARNADDEEFIELDEQFHLRIAEGAQLPILHAFLGQLRGFVRVARLGSPRPPSALATVVVEHERIVDALERRDDVAAVTALIEHLHTSDYGIVSTKRRQPA